MNTANPDLDPKSLTYDDKGLLPVVVQDVTSGAVLMLAYANQQAVELTLETGKAHFWSRSRKQLWCKGETSGNVLEVVEVTTDCDRDALLVRAHPAGPTCHKGTRSCFEPNVSTLELGWLDDVLRQRAEADPAQSYTARLLQEGIARVAQKVGEEGVETVIAAMKGEGGKEELVNEAADLLYHLLVLLRASGVEAGEVASELRRRHEGG